MEITKKLAGKTVTLALAGRLDTTTSPTLEEALSEVYDTADSLVFDMAELDYISSAGLRVILTAQKTMNKKGEMKLVNVKDTVLEVFEITGFTEILTIEK